MLRVTDLGKKGLWIHPTLKSNVDSLIINQRSDFDFVILISGSGMVRTGKSCLAAQLGYYIFYNQKQHYKFKTDFTVENNICFSSKDMIKKALAAKHPNVFVYDEAREGLDSKKLWQYATRTLLDFFAECGVLNHFYIIVLPDFFELPKGMAVTRSITLLDVFYLFSKATVKKGFGDIPKGTEYLKFHRGYYHAYNRECKKLLYNLGKRYQDYGKGKPNFKGEFTNFWVIDKNEYLKKKSAFLRRSRTEQYGGTYKAQRDYLIYILMKRTKVGTSALVKLLKGLGESNIGERTLQRITKDVEKKFLIFSKTPKPDIPT